MSTVLQDKATLIFCETWLCGCNELHCGWKAACCLGAGYHFLQKQFLNVFLWWCILDILLTSAGPLHISWTASRLDLSVTSEQIPDMTGIFKVGQITCLVIIQQTARKTLNELGTNLLKPWLRFPRAFTGSWTTWSTMWSWSSRMERWILTRPASTVTDSSLLPSAFSVTWRACTAPTSQTVRPNSQILSPHAWISYGTSHLHK